MLIFPYGTDAPIYHWPIATVVLIVVNTYAFFGFFMSAIDEPQAATISSAVREAQGEIEAQTEAVLNDEPADDETNADVPSEAGADAADTDDGGFEVIEIDPSALLVDPYEQAIDPYILHYGQGLRPWEWLTSNFMHTDFLHLLGNMFGLWGLGLIIEGKVGWWRFLLIYLGIGVGQSAMEQTMMLGAADGGSLGASAVVYGMIVIALLWAPKNDLHCVGWFGFRGGMFDVSIATFAAITLMLELVIAIVTKFSIGSAILHLMGAVLGAGVGLAMLKLRWVDCESWDLFSVWKDQQGQRDFWAPDPHSKKADPEVVEQSPEDRSRMALAQIRQLIDEGRPQLACAAHQRMTARLKGWALPASDYLKLIAAYHKQQLWGDSVPLMVDYLRKKHSERAAQVRLSLAKVLIEHEKRPAQALRVMEKISEAEMDEKLRKARAQLQRAAASQQAEGEIETQTEDW